MTSIWQALSILAFRQGVRLSARDLAAAAIVPLPAGAEAEVAAEVMRRFGFELTVTELEVQAHMKDWPAALRLRSGAWLVCQGLTDGQAEVVSMPEHAPTSAEGVDVALLEPVHVPLDQLQAAHDGTVVWLKAVASATSPDDADVPGAKREPHWFWSVFERLRPYYGDCVTAAVLINLLTLATSMFSMNVYDRIIPSGALHSLWVLAVGVMVAGVMELGLRTLRAHVLDEAGKRADLVLSAKIFRQTLALPAKDRPSSSGQFASQMREFESVRDFVSSSTLVTLTDLPFAILFFIVIAWMGGVLVMVPLLVAVLVIVVGFMAQRGIRESVQRYQYENTQKHAFLIEALERLETIEALGARASMQGKWERLCAMAARSAMSSRQASAMTLNLSQFLQQLSSTLLIVLGVYLILEGKLTSGALIGSSILAGRALGPLGQIAALIARWQHTRTAFESVDKMMALPSALSNRTAIQLVKVSGALEVQALRFSYPKTERVVLAIDALELRSGEVTAVMGPVGSGKSTLLRVLAKLQDPSEGRVLVNGLNVAQVSAADWRAQVAWVGQDAVLFRGSLRENLLLAAPRISEAHFLEVIELCGLGPMIAQHPHGLDMPVGEAGGALSGGQRQMVVLARALLSHAPILLLDEPTSAFDVGAEQALWQNLAPHLAGRTVLIATHRPGPLEVCQRLILLDAGHVVADGVRDQVLDAVRQGQIRRTKVAA